MPDVIEELSRYGDAVEAAAMAQRINAEALEARLAGVNVGADVPQPVPARRRLLAVAVVVVVAGAVLGAVLVTRSNDAPVDDVAATDRPTEPTAPHDIEPETGDWRRIEAGELALEPGINGVWREQMTAVWTGHEFIAWGGAGGPTYADGAAIDPRTSSWRSLATSPLDARAGHVAVWTGDEMVIWGGTDRGTGAEGARAFDDGAAYNPDSDTWRTLPESPLTGGGGYAAVWTGEEVVILGGTGDDFEPDGQDPATRHNEAASYNPDSDTWRVLPDLPIDLSFVTAHWTGDVVIAVGGQAFNNESVINRRGDVMGAVLDPKAGAWSELPASGISAQAATTVWVEGELYVFTYFPEQDGARAWVRDRNAWEDRPPIPSRGCEDVPVAAAYPDGILAGLCDVNATYLLATQIWSTIPLPDAPVENEFFTGFSRLMAWTGTEMLALHSDGTVWGYTP